MQTYKLRLGDGTVLGVDHDGLSTWLVDRGAMVQAVGSREWQPLREFLARERAAAKRASRHALRKPTARKDLPLIYPKPLGSQAPAPPPAAEPPASVPDEAASVEESSEVPFLAEAPSSVVIADPVAPESIPGDTPAIPTEPLVEAGPAEDPPSAWVEAQEPLAIVGPSEVQVLKDEVPWVAPAPESAPPPSDRREDLPSVLPEPRDAGAAPLLPDSSWYEALEPPAKAAVMDVEMPAEEPSPTALAFAPPPSVPEEPPLIPLEALAPVELEPPVVSAWRDPEPQLPARPSFQVLADDPVVRPMPKAPTADDAIIPLKPLEEDEARPSQAAEGGTDDEGGDSVPPGSPWRVRLEEIFREWIYASYALATDWTNRLSARGWRWPHPLSKLSEVYRGLSAGLVDLTDRAASAFTRPDGPGAADSSQPSVPARPAAAASEAALPVSSQPLNPPLSIREMPALRFANPPEKEEPGDVYEGETLLHASWRWTKRIVVVSGVVAVGVVAVLTWPRWFPTATQFGRAVVAEIDRRVVSRGEVERQQQAVQDAIVQVPHLSPETIRLILSTSPEGVLDPPEVFSVACEAADRGLSSLTPTELNELKALRVELLNTLRPSERERIREYDRVRARRLPFAFENRDVLDLFASGARVLPPGSRERLQELWGKAIAAGLAVPTEATPLVPPSTGR